MKKPVLIFFVLGVAGALFMFYFPIHLYQATHQTIRIPVMPIEMHGTVQNNAILRAKPDDVSAEVARLSQGSIVEISGISVDLKWYLVKHQNLQGQSMQGWASEDNLALPGINKEVSLPDTSNYLEPDAITLTSIPEIPETTETSKLTTPGDKTKESDLPISLGAVDLTITPDNHDKSGSAESGNTASGGQISGIRVGNKGGLMDDSGLVLIAYQDRDDDWIPGKTMSGEFPNESFHINWNAQSPVPNGPPSPFNPFTPFGFLALSQTSMPVYQPPTFTKPPYLSSKLSPVNTSTPTFTITPYFTRTPTKLITPTKTYSIFTPTPAPKNISPTPKPKPTSTNPPIFQPTSTKKPFISPTPR